MKKDAHKILTRTLYKVFIKINRISEALSEQEVQQFHSLLEKISQYDKSSPKKP